MGSVDRDHRRARPAALRHRRPRARDGQGGSRPVGESAGRRWPAAVHGWAPRGPTGSAGAPARSGAAGAGQGSRTGQLAAEARPRGSGHHGEQEHAVAAPPPGQHRRRRRQPTDGCHARPADARQLTGPATVTSTLRVSARRPIRITFSALSLADQIRLAIASAGSALGPPAGSAPIPSAGSPAVPPAGWVSSSGMPSMSNTAGSPAVPGRLHPPRAAAQRGSGSPGRSRGCAARRSPGRTPTAPRSGPTRQTAQPARSVSEMSSPRDWPSTCT